MLRNICYFGIVCIWLMSCASPRSTTVSSSQGSGYSEDLSMYRPKPATTPAGTNTNGTNTSTSVPGRKTEYMEPKYAVNKKVDPVLDSIDRYYLAKEYIDGFTIQIYAGLRREDALNAKKNLSQSLPEITSEVEYSQPNFRVKAGKYFTRIDAQKDYLSIKKYFPTAIVIPDKVPIR